MKRIFLAMAFVTLQIATAAAADASALFSDIPANQWYTRFVSQVVDAGIMSGYTDDAGKPTGKFGPSDTLTLAQALKIVCEGAGYDEDTYASSPLWFGTSTHWSAKYLAVAGLEKFQVINGPIDLDRPATRAEVAALVSSAFGLGPRMNSAGMEFKDVDHSGNTKYSFMIAQISADGVMSGDTDANGNYTGYFRPKDGVNRAEMTKVILAARAKYGEYGKGRTPKK